MLTIQSNLKIKDLDTLSKILIKDDIINFALGNVGGGFTPAIADKVATKLKYKGTTLIINDISLQQTDKLLELGYKLNEITLAFGKWNKDGTVSTDRTVYNIMKAIIENNIEEKLNVVFLGDIFMGIKHWDSTIINPPYDRSLHLEILASVLSTVRAINSKCEVVSIQPARWLEDLLADQKPNSAYNKYKAAIVDKISDIDLVSIMDASAKFKIGAPCDLGIYSFNDTKNFSSIYSSLVISIVNKIVNKSFVSLLDKREAEQLDGWRVEIKKEIQEGQHNAGNAESSKKAPVKICLGPYFNGYDSNNIFWSLGRTKNQHTRSEGSAFPFSIKFNSELEALNFVKSCQTNFYKNLIHLLKSDIVIPLKYLPYMEDYSHSWSDEDFCKYFNLTVEEAEFMCRTIDDYRIKDFINYAKFED